MPLIPIYFNERSTLTLKFIWNFPRDNGVVQFDIWVWVLDKTRGTNGLLITINYQSYLIILIMQLSCEREYYNMFMKWKIICIKKFWAIEKYIWLSKRCWLGTHILLVNWYGEVLLYILLQVLQANQAFILNEL